MKKNLLISALLISSSLICIKALVSDNKVITKYTPSLLYKPTVPSLVTHGINGTIPLIEKKMHFINLDNYPKFYQEVTTDILDKLPTTLMQSVKDAFILKYGWSIPQLKRTLLNPTFKDASMMFITFDGKKILAPDDKGSLRKQSLKIWDIATGNLIKSIDAGWISALTLTPDNKTAIIGSTGNTIKFIDLDTSTLIQTLNGHTTQIEALTTTADGHYLLAASADNVINIWDIPTGKLIKTMPIPYIKSISALAITPDGKKIIIGSLENTIVIIDSTTGKLLRQLPQHKGWISALVVTPDNRTLMSASADNIINIWDIDNGTLKASITEHTRPIKALTLILNGKVLISGSLDFTIKVWAVGSFNTILEEQAIRNTKFERIATKKVAKSTLGPNTYWMQKKNNFVNIVEICILMV